MVVREGSGPRDIVAESEDRLAEGLRTADPAEEGDSLPRRGWASRERPKNNPRPPRDHRNAGRKLPEQSKSVGGRYGAASVGENDQIGPSQRLRRFA
jgi:hypothetical protein